MVQTRFLLLSVFIIVFMGHDFEVDLSVSCSILVSVALPDVHVLGNHLRLTGKHQDPARSARTTPAYKGVYLFLNNMLLQGCSVVKKICLQCRRPGFDSWVRKMPWRRKWQPTPVFLPGESHGQRSLAGCSPGGHKSQTRLSE